MAPNQQNPDFEQHIANLPGSAQQLALDVVVLAERGEELQAESILRIALGKHGASGLRIALAHVLIRQNRHKEAMTEMVSVLRADPENADALLVLATCLMECGELDRGGKMLQKARLAGADEAQAQELEDRWHDLVAKSTNPGFADLTLPDIGEGGVVASNPEQTEEAQRKRHETLMGRPTTDRLSDPPNFDVGDPTGRTGPKAPDSSGKPRRLPPPPLQSGTFASLDTWDLDDADENDLDTTAIAPEKLRLSDEGPLERIPIPKLADSSGEYASPNDMTSALVLDDDEFAAPDEPTAHIPYDEVERGLQAEQHRASTVERDIDNMPSVEYDAGFAAEAQDHGQAHPPPSDLDDSPAYDSDVGDFGLDPPTREEQWGAQQQNNLDERPVARSMIDYGDWNEIPSRPHEPQRVQPQHQQQAPPQQHQPPGPFQSAPSFSQPHQPHEQSFQLEGNAAPQAPPQPPGGLGPVSSRREETAVAASPTSPAAASSSIRVLIEKRWPLVLVIFLAVLLGGFLLVTIGSGVSLASSLRSGMQAATTARTNDTFTGFEEAEEQLVEVTTTNSFMGSGFDRFVESTLPIPGLSGANLRRRSVADLAAVSAILEYRFEKVGTRKAQERLAAAQEMAADEPATAVAAAYVEMAANDPAGAIELLEAARGQHPGEVRLAEALAWAQLALDRPAQAAQTVQDLRDSPAPSVHQKFLLASVDSARGDEKAARAFADVFADSPDHADARIGRALALIPRGEKALEDAQKALDAVLTKLEESTSSFQKARATSAYGSLHLASNRKEEAEQRFRSAVAKMPMRGELYPPLLHYLENHEDKEKQSELDGLLDKARGNDAYTVELAFYEAELRLMRSKPEKTLEILGALSFEDTRKAFLHGFALLDQYRPQQASEILEKGQNAPGDPLHAQALFYVARSLASEDAVQDANHQLERIKSKNADSAVVHWASANVSATAAQITTSKATRDKQLDAARADIERAHELDPNWAPIHFTRCEILMRVLDTENAEKYCFSGRKLAPDYAPGLVTTARLRLMEGKIEDAKQLSDRALELRPDDPVVGLLAARVAVERRELDKAEKLINRWLGKAVDKYEHSLLEGRLEFARENYTRAAGYLKSAFEMRPNEGEAAIYYGHTLARLEDYGNAGTLLKKFLNHPTWSGYAWAVLGEVRRKQRKLRDAYENLDKAIKIYSDQSVPARYWSHVYTEYALANRIKYRKWRHPQVKRMLDRGRKKGDPDDPGLNMTYGQYYLNLRRPDYGEAMKHIQKVVDVAPYRCDAVEALRSLYKRADRSEEDLQRVEDIYAKNCAPAEEKK